MALRRKCCPQITSQSRCGDQVQMGQPCLFVTCGQNSQDTKYVSRWPLSPWYVKSYQPSSFSAWLDQPIKYHHVSISSSARNRYMNCPKQLGLWRIYHCFPSVAFPYYESSKCLGKVIRFFHCYGNTVLCSYWNIQPASIQYQDSQMPAKYPSKARFSKANVVLAFNKEKRKFFSPNSLRLLQMMALLLACCTQQLCLPLTTGGCS